MLINVADSNGVIHEVPFAMTLSELPYSQHIDFTVAQEDIKLWAKKCADLNDTDDDSFINNDEYYCYLLSRAVSKYTGYDLNKVMKFDTSDMVDSEGNLLPHVIAAPKPEQKIDLQSAENTLSQLYQMAVNVVSSYEFRFKGIDDCQFEYHGKTWVIPHVVKRLFDETLVFSKFDTQQSVETLMIKVFLQENVNNKRANMDSSDVENKRFTCHLSILSACLKEVVDGIELDHPYQKNDFESMISDRIIFFKDIDAQRALDIVFFLTNITTNSQKIQRINGILINQIQTLLTK